MNNFTSIKECIRFLRQIWLLNAAFNFAFEYVPLQGRKGSPSLGGSRQSSLLIVTKLRQPASDLTTTCKGNGRVLRP